MKRRYRVTNVTRQQTLAESSEKASDPVSRGIGLMGRKSLPSDGGLIIEPCSGVVSFFMRFPIDVIFVDKEGRIKSMIERMVPWRSSAIVRGSKLVVELPAGTIERTGTEVGDVLGISEI